MSSTNFSGATGSSTYQPSRRISTETKSAVKTTELIAFIVVAVAVLIAANIVKGFDAQHAWLYVSMLTIGYMISRGLAKSGSRDFYDDDTSASREH
jgi:di/tricarboxylate transporter